jgi:hypothetical protein
MENILYSRFRHSKRGEYSVRIPSGISNRLTSVCFTYKKGKTQRCNKRRYKTREEALEGAKAFFEKQYRWTRTFLRIK